MTVVRACDAVARSSPQYKYTTPNPVLVIVAPMLKRSDLHRDRVLGNVTASIL